MVSRERPLKSSLSKLWVSVESLDLHLHLPLKKGKGRHGIAPRVVQNLAGGYLTGIDGIHDGKVAFWLCFKNEVLLGRCIVRVGERLDHELLPQPERDKRHEVYGSCG